MARPPLKLVDCRNALGEFVSMPWSDFFAQGLTYSYSLTRTHHCLLDDAGWHPRSSLWDLHTSDDPILKWHGDSTRSTDQRQGC